MDLLVGILLFLGLIAVLIGFIMYTVVKFDTNQDQNVIYVSKWLMGVGSLVPTIGLITLGVLLLVPPTVLVTYHDIKENVGEPKGLSISIQLNDENSPSINDGVEVNKQRTPRIVEVVNKCVVRVDVNYYMMIFDKDHVFRLNGSCDKLSAENVAQINRIIKEYK